MDRRARWVASLPVVEVETAERSWRIGSSAFTTATVPDRITLGHHMFQRWLPVGAGSIQIVPDVACGHDQSSRIQHGRCRQVLPTLRSASCNPLPG